VAKTWFQSLLSLSTFNMYRYTPGTGTYTKAAAAAAAAAAVVCIRVVGDANSHMHLGTPRS
jgi:hypothetical protein